MPDLNLAASLECGQAFRWRREPDGWFTGVVGGEVWRVRQQQNRLQWQCRPEADDAAANRIRGYLALDRSLAAIVASFPADAALSAAVQAHWGMRVLRQDGWETLVSFMASATKQITQIRQIVELLARRFGEPLADGMHAFPTPARLARASTAELWECKLGFRAPRVLAAAQAVDSGQLDLAALGRWELPRAREELLKLAGVGEKIANCVLLFGCGQDAAFPIDVWIARSLKRLYFPRRRVSPGRLRAFTKDHFGPHAGWAQQYLFHAERNRPENPRLSIGRPQDTFPR